MTVVTSLQRPVAIYREEQNFGWWVYLLLALVSSVGLWIAFVGIRGPAGATTSWSLNLPLGLALGLLLPGSLLVGVLRMTTEVTPHQCHVWFGWIPTISHSIALETVKSVEVVQYRPILDCGGWGLRRCRGGIRVLSARGNRAVKLVLTDGSRLLIGSQRPTELAEAINQGITHLMA